MLIFNIEADGERYRYDVDLFFSVKTAKSDAWASLAYCNLTTAA